MNFIALFLLLFSHAVYSLEFGVNMHHVSGREHLIDELGNRNLLNAVRLDFNVDTDVTAIMPNLLKIKARGGRIEAILHPLQDYDHSCNQNFAAVETASYNDASLMINKLKGVVMDFEIMNEIPLRSELRPEVPFNTAINDVTKYQNKPCYATVIAKMKGINNAIHDIAVSSNMPLRSILGIVGRDYAFVKFAISQGVQPDVIGYHVYPRFGQASLLTDTWYGDATITTLFPNLAQFNLPVKVNEFDCGEIYDADYDNVKGSAKTIKCNNALKQFLPYFFQQTAAKIETISFYEAIDAPTNPAPENRFGLMYDQWNPKVQLFMASLFAGGYLSPAERSLLFAQNGMTCLSIYNYRNKALYPSLNINVNGPASCL